MMDVRKVFLGVEEMSNGLEHMGCVSIDAEVVEGFEKPLVRDIIVAAKNCGTDLGIFRAHIMSDSADVMFEWFGASIGDEEPITGFCILSDFNLRIADDDDIRKIAAALAIRGIRYVAEEHESDDLFVTEDEEDYRETSAVTAEDFGAEWGLEEVICTRKGGVVTISCDLVDGDYTDAGITYRLREGREHAEVTWSGSSAYSEEDFSGNFMMEVDTNFYNKQSVIETVIIMVVELKELIDQSVIDDERDTW